MIASEAFLYYSRQIALQDVGIQGQEKLRAARVVCIGAGGLGCPALQYLAAMGIGHILIVDADTVDLSNLHRQVLYTVEDVGEKKAIVAQKRLSAMNPDITVHVKPVMLTPDNAHAMLSDADIVLDCSDNFSTRYLVNDVCSSLGTPYVYAAISDFKGSISVFCADDGPCYRCLFPEPPPEGAVKNCAEAGVLGVLPGMLGVMQANEVMKWILNIGDTLVGRLLIVDALTMSVRSYTVSHSKDCEKCGSYPLAQDVLPTGSASCISASPASSKEISVEELSNCLNERDVFLLDVREPHEYAYYHIDAHSIPLGMLREKCFSLPKAKTIIVICHSGFRSQKAASLIRETLKIDEVYSLRGGLLAWARYQTQKVANV